MKRTPKSRHKKNIRAERQELERIEKQSEKRKQAERISYLEAISETISLPPDILAGAPIMNIQGRNSLLLENYKKILEYTDSLIRIQTKLYYVSIEGNDLCILYYTKDEMKINGVFRSIQFS